MPTSRTHTYTSHEPLASTNNPTFQPCPCTPPPLPAQASSATSPKRAKHPLSPKTSTPQHPTTSKKHPHPTMHHPNEDSVHTQQHPQSSRS
ncbi:hypothetical protein L207DRAFT_508523 [Hyaloscypha variabilis F]|uniref:Uncharacterized protein n=1 Tax=Hyaloscypha variabilis (strain UAMH 11265 / GT02V1 / F) TaxID=1149755 RepID=A0A2J6S4M0_HYAVF|nr:hypothetical protein L207DRAFT_508523 [Hyaloscypha variabilis F]